MLGEYYVYQYKTPEGIPFYVGKGKSDRAFSHLQEAKKEQPNETNLHKLNKIKKILAAGSEPIIEITYNNLDEETAFDLECFLIAKLGRADLGLGPLTNLTNGGEGLSGLVRDLSGETNPNYGKRGEESIWWGRKHSQETKSKMSDWQKGQPKSEAAKANMRKPKSEAGRLAIAEAQRKLHENGYPHSEESNIKRSNTLKGRPYPMKGKNHSEEARIKMSTSGKGTKKKTKQCPHCLKEVACHVFTRWHDNNCKDKGGNDAC